MKVDYVDHMGDDLTVVNAARVSFDKESEWDDWPGSMLKEKDSKLITYLAKHGHWSPFAHVMIQTRWKAPIFVARQLVKHQIGLTWNEVSRRYVSSPPELYWPDEWRQAAANVKQGSSSEAFTDPTGLLEVTKFDCQLLVDRYSRLIDEGLCPEQARMILPQNMYTEWYWTGSLMAWARVYRQRTYSGAQKETRDLVLTLDNICGMVAPVSWEALKGIKDE